MVRSCLSSYYRGSQHLICISALKKLCNHPVLLLNATRKNTNPASHHKSGEDEDDILLEDEDCLYDDLYTVFPNAYESCYEAADSGKLKVLDRLLCAFKDQHEKVVIVSNSTKTLDVIESLLKTKAQKYLRLDGQTLMSDRMKLVDRFNSNFSDIDVFMLSSKAGGTGLNLIGASRLVLYDIDWNPANDLQAMARIWRDGQKKKVHIYRLLATGTIEEKIFQRQVKKQSLSGSVVDSGSSKANFSHEDLKDLFTFHESTTCSTHELLSCNCRYLEYEVPVESTTTETTRSSQLGINPKKTEKKQRSMAELMSWTHIEPPCTEKLKDQVLASCLQGVTFIFQYESKECN